MKALTIAAHAALALPALAFPDLYTNGPFITNPGAASGGAHASAVQTFVGANSYGFTHQAFANNRLADNFTVASPQGWTVSSILFHSFQSGSGTTASTFTSLNLRIWSGRPGDPASTILYGDAATNRLGTSVWSGVYRTSDTNLSGANRPVFAVEAVLSPPAVLPPGEYWIDWQAAGTLESGPWAVPVTIPGQPGVAGANARFYDGAAQTWTDLRDGGSASARQDLTFIVRGTVGGGTPPCFANCDGSTAAPILNVNDFICFQQRYAAGNTAANCDGSTAAPVLNVNDFICFQQKYAAGCP